VAEAGRSGRRIQRWVLAILDDGSACPHGLLSRVPPCLRPPVAIWILPINSVKGEVMEYRSTAGQTLSAEGTPGPRVS
jgi:hypothetical protein